MHASASAGSYTLVAQHPIPAEAQVALWPASDIGIPDVTYSVGFTTSPTGALGNFGSITVSLPSGTTMINSFVVQDVTSGQSSDENAAISGTKAVIPTSGVPIATGDQVLVTINDVTNGPHLGTNTVSVSTSSDSGTATGSYKLGPDLKVTGTITYQSTTGTAPVEGSLVEACDSSNCAGAIAPSDAQGNYTLHVPASGSYTVSAFAPTSGAR